MRSLITKYNAVTAKQAIKLRWQCFRPLNIILKRKFPWQQFKFGMFLFTHTQSATDVIL